jgi:hypothetical protein
MMNMKLYRTPIQNLVSTVVILIGFLLVTLSITDIRNEFNEKKAQEAAMMEGEEGGVAENEEAKPQEGENSGTD